MKLHGYFRSSAAFRVRIALNLKNLPYDQASVHLRRGEQLAPGFLKLNPQGLVPALEDGPHLLTQSLAIAEYLDETHPEPPFLPKAPAERARVRALALAVSCDIHPIYNLRRLLYAKRILKVSDEQHHSWYRHWIHEGFKGIEGLLKTGGSRPVSHRKSPRLGPIRLGSPGFNCPP